MKKRFVKVALMSLATVASTGAFVACSDDDWKDPMNNVETSVDGVNKTISALNEQVKALEGQIAANKSAAEAAAKAAADALAAAQAAADDAEAAKKYADEAAKKYAEEAAANALAQAAEQLKSEIEAVIALIKENSDNILANSTKIEGNTKAIEDILERLGGLDANYDELSKTMTGLSTALEALQGELSALGLDVTELEEALRAEIGTLEQNLAEEAVKREEGDNALQSQIDALKSQLEALNLSQNLEDLAEFVKSANTQLAALDEYQKALNDKLTALSGKVDGIDAIVSKNKQDIAALTTKLGEVEQKAKDNAAAILVNAGKIKENADAIKVLQDANEEIVTAVEELTLSVSDIVERLNALEPLLNTMILDQLRGLVFIPESFVDGIESALSYHMDYKALVAKKGTPNVYNALAGYKVANYPLWNVAPTGDAKVDDKTFESPTIVSYHMNPKSAVVTFDALSIVSNQAEILTRANEAGIKLDPTYNEGAGFKVADDGVLSVSLTGNAPLYEGSNKMPVFALQAEVMGTTDEDGKEVKNTVTSDYAMFVQMKVTPEAILWNQPKYTAHYGSGAMRNFTEVQTNANINTTLLSATSATVAWNGTVDLKDLLKVSYEDIQRGTSNAWTSAETWEKYGLKMNFQLIDYYKGDNKVSESSWAVIDPETGVLTACVGKDATKQSADALGHEPLVYITMTQGDNVVLDGFVKIKIVPTEDYFVTGIVTYPNVDFRCADFNDNPVQAVQNENVYILPMILEKTGLSESVFLANYKPVLDAMDETPDEAQVMTQFVKNGNEWIQVASDKVLGKIVFNPKMTATGTFYDLLWVLDTDGLQLAYQTAYEDKPHTAIAYVCFQATSDSYSDVYVPMTITVNDKAVFKAGEKVLARWYRENDNTALLNVPQPENGKQVTTINTVLNQLWVYNGVAEPHFAQVSGNPTSAPVAGFKYYFTAENNRTFEGVTYSVANATNPNLIGGSAANSNMKNFALLTTDGLKSEYNNTELFAGGVKIATLNPKNGQITYETTPQALVYLNKFNSFGGEDRPEAKLEAIIGMVPYSSCDIAYAMENPSFNVAFLKPINAINTDTPKDFVDAESNGSEIWVFDQIVLWDWRNVDFKGNEWLYGYYNVKKITPNLKDMTTNIANPESSNFTKATQQLIDAFQYTPMAEITYDPSIINPASNAAMIAKLKAEMGKIVYMNTDSNVKKFQVKIPYTVEYGLGILQNIVVTYTITPTLGNN